MNDFSRKGAKAQIKPQRISALLVLFSLCVFLCAFAPLRAKVSPAIKFTDITAQAGITFKHVASPDKKYIVESMSGGVALFDYDNDGDLDIFFVNSLTVDLVKSKGKTKSALYRNDGNGKFTEVGEKAGVSDIGWGMGVAVDLVKSKGKTKSALYRNDGNGKLTEVGEKAGVSEIGWGMGVAVDLVKSKGKTKSALY